MGKRVCALVFSLLLMFASTIALAADEESLGMSAELAGKTDEALAHYTNALRSTSKGSDAESRLREDIVRVSQKLGGSTKVPEEANKSLRNLAGRWCCEVFDGMKDYYDLIVTGDNTFTMEYKYSKYTVGEPARTKNILNMTVHGDRLEGTHTHWTDLSYMGFSVEEKTFPASGMISDNGNTIVIELDHPWPSNQDGGRWTLQYGKVHWIFTRAR
ncbi:MAG: hypothetical protein PHE61_08170 [Candidatus Omnitrophica bacterium]|nr:hypothetical protein [Candidatus Omnitrophota bacterium]